jgi:hypothetical protein
MLINEGLVKEIVIGYYILANFVAYLELLK